MPLRSLWIETLQPLLDRDELKRRVRVQPSPIDDLSSLPFESACQRIDKALKVVFYPTEQCLAILGRLVGEAYAHAQVAYPDERTFLCGVYSEAAPLPDFVFPVCLTGYGGVGKTALLLALRRAVGAPVPLAIDGQPMFAITGAWQLTVRAQSGAKDILRATSGSDGSIESLIRTTRKVAYRDGVSRLSVDEFQFATGSPNANTRLAQILLSLGYIGLPYLFSANFSMINRLLRRPGEELERLLSKPIVLQPDSCYSEDWKETLRAQREVAPDWFVFDPEEDAPIVHAFTAGRKRAAAHLLWLAFRNEYSQGKVVDRAALQRAYHSSGFSTHRIETDIIVSQAIQNRPNKHRKDLWCPIQGTELDAPGAFAARVVSQREEALAEAEITMALTKEEKMGANHLKRLSRDQGKSGDVVPLRRQRVPLSAEDLKRNASLLRGDL